MLELARLPSNHQFPTKVAAERRDISQSVLCTVGGSEGKGRVTRRERRGADPTPDKRLRYALRDERFQGSREAGRNVGRCVASLHLGVLKATSTLHRLTCRYF